MSRDELYRFYLSCHFSEDFALRMVKKAEDFAKQQSILFMNWTLEGDCTYSCTDENQWTNINDPYDSITTEQLHNQFIEKQQQNKEQ